jgi:hypothetical protein
VRYRIDCIGDAIDPALHNMPMNQSEIKRKKNLSLSQAFSDWTAFATISNTNHLCCGAAAFGEGSRRPGGRFRRRAGPCWRLMADHKTSAVLAKRYDHFALPQGRDAEKSADSGAAGRLTGRSPGNFLDAVTVRPAFSCV